MDPPHFVLDVLKDSVASGTFIDAKFYVFSRREASGRVGSPRASYCNSRVLNTVPYFSALFSEGFSEGQIRDINEGFPADSEPHTESYDYLSDSDLEDESSFSREGEDEHQGGSEAGEKPNDRDELGLVRAPRDPDSRQPENTPGGMGIAPIIGDIAAFKPAKLIYRLADKYNMQTLKERAKVYIHESPCSSEDEEEPREGNGGGGGNKAGPSRSPHGSNSHIPPTTTLKNLQQLSQDAHNTQDNHLPNNNLARTGKVAVIRDMAAITFEAMIYFLYTERITFAPIGSDPRRELPAEARAGDWRTARPPSPSAKSIYRLADKYDIPTLKEQAKAHIYDSLAHCDIVEEVFSSFSLSFPEIRIAQVSQLVSKMKEESRGGAESPTRRQLLEKIATLPPSRLARTADVLTMIWNGVTGPLDLPTPEAMPTSPTTFSLLPNWHRVKLALLKSISTGNFIDVHVYACNAIRGTLPLDPRPLFTSSIVVEEWGPAILASISAEAACLMDGLADDYECQHEELPQMLNKGKAVLKYQAEAAAAESHEAMTLMSGAWKTWLLLFSYAYTNEIAFAPLQTSDHDGDPVASTKWQQSCSPRSMYSLAERLGIEDLKQEALNDIQSKLTISNVAQELFTSFAASHEAVMDMEIEFFRRNLAEQNPKLFMDYVQKMAPEESPFLPATLSLVYSKLFEKVFPQPTASGSGSTSTVDPPSTLGVSSSGPRAPAPEPEPEPPGTIGLTALLKCSQCGNRAALGALYGGLYCPRCPSKGIIWRERPFMHCPFCNTARTTRLDHCLENACQARFRY